MTCPSELRITTTGPRDISPPIPCPWQKMYGSCDPGSREPRTSFGGSVKFPTGIQTNNPPKPSQGIHETACKSCESWEGGVDHLLKTFYPLAKKNVSNGNAFIFFHTKDYFLVMWCWFSRVYGKNTSEAYRYTMIYYPKNPNPSRSNRIGGSNPILRIGM